ncbi:MAG TPA: S-methyl-5-thioribose-1-phosphate isomerase [Polyangiaceae bacterium]|nr:S-methyl-5-thioribose-1-phosphate isomerase [Polyangiaceae bacterium]
MNVDGKAYRAIALAGDGETVEIIDQTRLPHEFVLTRLSTLEDAAMAIRDMLVRGAPLIGVTAAYGLALAMRTDASDAALARACTVLSATRPTAVNLHAALARMRGRLAPLLEAARASAARALATELADEDVAQNRAIGAHGHNILRTLSEGPARGRPLRVMTHCNAGWLATVDGGTALAPVYAAHDAGIALEVWVSETRPRNQGASLTAWELGKHGVRHTGIVDNAAGHLMQNGEVDVVIVGTDRTTARGDVANKIGTYLKAVAAHDCGVPFYVAAPSSSIDWGLDDGRAVPIEERAAHEITHATGRAADAHRVSVRLWPEGARVKNVGFDVTPARLVTGLITERGVCEASKRGLAELFAERAASA